MKDFLKLKIYKAVLEMILKDKDKLFLTGKQRCHIGNLIHKIERIEKQI